MHKTRNANNQKELLQNKNNRYQNLRDIDAKKLFLRYLLQFTFKNNKSPQPN